MIRKSRLDCPWPGIRTRFLQLAQSGEHHADSDDVWAVLRTIIAFTESARSRIVPGKPVATELVL